VQQHPIPWLPVTLAALPALFQDSALAVLPNPALLALFQDSALVILQRADYLVSNLLPTLLEPVDCSVQRLRPLPLALRLVPFLNHEISTCILIIASPRPSPIWNFCYPSNSELITYIWLDKLWCFYNTTHIWFPSFWPTSFWFYDSSWYMQLKRFIHAIRSNSFHGGTCSVGSAGSGFGTPSFGSSAAPTTMSRPSGSGFGSTGGGFASAGGGFASLAGGSSGFANLASGGFSGLVPNVGASPFGSAPAGTSNLWAMRK